MSVPNLPFVNNVWPGYKNAYFPGSASANYFYSVYGVFGSSFLDSLHAADRISGEYLPGRCLSNPGCYTFFAQQGSTLPMWMNAGEANFHALTVAFRRRFSNGLQFDFNYTWSHSIDNGSAAESGAGEQGASIQDIYNLSAFRGSSDFDIRHNFNMGGTYTFPTWSAAGRFGTGWEIGSVFTAETGAPWTPVLSRSHDNSGEDNTVQRPDCILAPHYDFSNPNLFITNAATAFAFPAPGTLGTCGRNSLRVRGLQQWDMNLTKLTKITERMSIQFRWEVYNVMNHANFSFFPANSTFSGGGSVGLAGNGFAGLSTTPDVLNPGVAQGSPRSMQFALKLIF